MLLLLFGCSLQDNNSVSLFVLLFISLLSISVSVYVSVSVSFSFSFSFSFSLSLSLSPLYYIWYQPTFSFFRTLLNCSLYCSQNELCTAYSFDNESKLCSFGNGTSYYIYTKTTTSQILIYYNPSKVKISKRTSKLK